MYNTAGSYFPPMRRAKQQLTEGECTDILKNEWRGVLSINGGGGHPYGVPLDFVYDADNGKIYFHCAKTGHKLDLLKNDPRVSFCVYDKGFRREGEWALNIKCVIAFGTVRFITDFEETVARVRQLGLKYYPTPEECEAEVINAASRVQMLEMTIEHMTGKIVNES